MSKYHVLKPIHHDGDHVTAGVVDLDDKIAADHIARGHLAPAPADAEVTHDFKPKAAPKKGKDA